VSSDGGAPRPNRTEGSILVVDDDAGKRYVLSRILRSAGFEIIEAEDASSALALAKNNPDLLILDVKLPDGSGHDVCRELKSRADTSSILVLQVSSSFASSPDIVAGLDSGADAYLTHPIEAQELTATVRALLRIRRAEQERSELFAREQAARQEADRANRLKDQFLATISHELRTPLNAILGWVQLLRTGRLDAAAGQHALEIVERNARAQSALIEDLLDMSRIMSEKLAIEFREVDLKAILHESVEAFRIAADAKAISIRTRIEPAAGLVRGDAPRLKQVVWNLLSNAIKFTPQAGEIEVSLASVGGGTEVRVRDNGRGILPEFLPHVFEPFRQAESNSRRAQGGIGLGLTIARQLVELHGGHVRVESEGLDRGSTFIVNLPALSAATAEAAAMAERPGAEAPPAAPAAAVALPPVELPSLGALRVLVIDDERDTLDYASTVLRQAGAEVSTAESVAAGLEQASAFHPDAILCDIAMPIRDGFDLIAELRRLPGPERAIPVAALTAHAKPEDQRRILDAGFQLFVAKPVDPLQIASAVLALTARAAGDGELPGSRW
jgi:signal transduction histidine kinase